MKERIEFDLRAQTSDHFLKYFLKHIFQIYFFAKYGRVYNVYNEIFESSKNITLEFYYGFHGPGREACNFCTIIYPAKVTQRTHLIFKSEEDGLYESLCNFMADFYYRIQ